jgi:hypothetical protein
MERYSSAGDLPDVSNCRRGSLKIIHVSNTLLTVHGVVFEHFGLQGTGAAIAPRADGVK